MRRGSTTISWAPSRNRRFIREANTGCPSVGLAPITMITSASATERKSWVPADSPKVCLSPYPVGEWQTRAQVSTLLLPKAARTIFCTTYTSSLVQREEVMAPTELVPYRSWSSRIRRATVPIASSHSTSRQGSVIFSRTMGLRTRSGWVA